MASSEVELGFDASLFTGPSASAGWNPSYVTGNIVTPVSALWADQGEANGIRSRQPGCSARARIFADLLEDRGIKVTGEPDRSEGARRTRREVASMESATVAQIVDALVRTSDNQAAEVMLRHVAIAADRPATFDGGADAVTRGAQAGRHRHDRSAAPRRQRVVARQPGLADDAGADRDGRDRRPADGSPLLSDLPVSGFSGTLSDRFSTVQGAPTDWCAPRPERSPACTRSPAMPSRPTACR